MSPKMKQSSNGNEVFVPYLKPEKLTALESLKRGFYDPKTKAVFGRTLKGWGKLQRFIVKYLG